VIIYMIWYFSLADSLQLKEKVLRTMHDNQIDEDRGKFSVK